jgi:hypothetical protein
MNYVNGVISHDGYRERSRIVLLFGTTLILIRVCVVRNNGAPGPQGLKGDQGVM